MADNQDIVDHQDEQGNDDSTFDQFLTSIDGKAGPVDAFVIEKFPNINHGVRYVLGNKPESFFRGQPMYLDGCNRIHVQRYEFGDEVVRVVGDRIHETRYHFLWNNATRATVLSTADAREYE